MYLSWFSLEEVFLRFPRFYKAYFKGHAINSINSVLRTRKNTLIFHLDIM